MGGGGQKVSESVCVGKHKDIYPDFMCHRVGFHDLSKSSFLIGCKKTLNKGEKGKV